MWAAVFLCHAQTGSFQQVSGSLSQISVGADGTVWGLDSSQNIFTWDSGASQFVQVPGQLVQIAVGNVNAVWGLNAQGLIFRWNSAKQTWTYIPGYLNQIAVGADGDVWGLSANTSGQCSTNATADISDGCTFVWHYNQQAQTWQYVDTSKITIYLGVTQLAVGNDGAVYALIDASPGYLDPFWYNPGTGQFQNVSGYAYAINGEGAVGSLAVGYDGDLWADGASLAHYSPLQPEWQAITPVSDGIAKLAVGSGANVFGIANSLTPDGAVYQWNAQTAAWVPLGIALSQIAAGAEGSAWGIDSYHRVFRFNAPTQTYPALRALPGSLQQISVGADGTAWGVDANDLIYIFDRQTQTWQNVPGALAQVSVGSSGDVWGVNSGDAIWLWGDQDSANSPPGWENAAGALTQTAVAANGSVFGINTYGQTYWYSSYQWVNIPGTLVQLSAGADGTVWGINAGQQIYRYDSKANQWVNVPGALVQISVGNVDNVWGVNAEQHVYRYDATIPGWIQIPDALLTRIAVAFDGAVWGVNDAGGLYQWDSATQTFNLIGTGMTDVAVGSDASVFAWNKNTGATYWYF